MHGSNRLVLIVAVLVLTGAGCLKRSNPTPFVLPTNSPPAPLVDSASGDPEESPAIEVANLPVTVYLIALEQSTGLEKAQVTAGAEKIGCGDYVVPVTVPVTGNPLSPLRNALTALFKQTVEDAASKGYYTALGGSSITVGDIAKKGDGTYVIDLRGEFLPAGECDDPRIKAQVEKTAGQYGKAEILLNGAESGWRCFGNLSGNCR